MKPVRRGAKPAAKARRSSSRAVIALAVMGGLAVLYGWNSFFLAPKGAAKEKVQTELAASRRQETELRRNLSDLRKLANDSQAREAELSRLGRLIPADPDVDGVILTLNETAHQAQVAWSSFVPTNPTRGSSGVAAISITMKISGTFQQVFDYLRRLEQLDRLVVVDSLQLGGGGAQGPGGSRIEADIKARMFSSGTTSPSAATSAAAKAPANPSETSALPKAGG